MKHTVAGIILFFLVLFVVMPATSPGADKFPKPRGLINDFAGVIHSPYLQKLEQVTADLLKKTGVPIVVVTMPEIGGDDYNEYANRLYSAWGIGKKGEDRGVLVFVTIKERKMRIETGYGVEGIIPDGLAGEIRDLHMIPYLKQGRYGEGLMAGTIALAQVIADNTGVNLSGKDSIVKRPKKRSGLAGLLFPLIFLGVLFFMGRRRGGLLPFLLLMFMGRGGGYGHGRGRGGFGGFGGGFGGFGGGMSGGGGAGGGF